MGWFVECYILFEKVAGDGVRCYEGDDCLIEWVTVSTDMISCAVKKDVEKVLWGSVILWLS